MNYNKEKYRAALLVFCALLFVFPLCSQRVWSPADMPNVQKANRNEYVSDPGNLMSPQAKAEVNRKLTELRQQTTAEVAVALPPDIGDMPIEEWSEKLFTLWGIGKGDKDNGVLVVIAPEQRRARIQTGYGAEGVLPDISCINIINSTIIPAMKEGDINLAVINSTGMIYSAMTDPEVAEELRSSERDNFSEFDSPISGKELWGFVQIVATLIFLVTMVVFIRGLVIMRGKDSYHRAIYWRRQLEPYFIIGVLSLGSGLVWWALAYLLYRRARLKKRVCPQCGTKMERLNEEDDNAYLSASQDFEEQLKTVDYDVWKCPKCHAMERYPYRENQLKYSECPSCHTVAMCLTGVREIRPATTRSYGEGEKIYECKFCHNQNRRRYRIEKKVDEAAAALAAGAILGSSRGGRGGGGGFGGGFGGGMTGGGGASGGW